MFTALNIEGAQRMALNIANYFCRNTSMLQCAGHQSCRLVFARRKESVQLLFADTFIELSSSFHHFTGDIMHCGSNQNQLPQLFAMICDIIRDPRQIFIVFQVIAAIFLYEIHLSILRLVIVV